MPIVKTFSVGDGDTFYIQHGSDNFSIIDCNLKKTAAKKSSMRSLRCQKERVLAGSYPLTRMTTTFTVSGTWTTARQ